MPARPQSRRALAALVGAVAVLCCGARPSAAATPLPLELDWSAPPECPTAEQVQRELSHITRARTGRSLVALTTRAEIVRIPAGYRLTLAVSGHGTEHESRFESPTCGPLLKAATLVLTLAFGDGEPLAPPTPPAATPTPSLSRDVGPETRRSGAAGLRLTPWGGGVVSSGFIGPAALGADVGLGVRGRFWSSFGRAYAFGPRVAAERDGVTAELSAAIGALGACGSMPGARLHLHACLAFAAGAVWAHSRGAEHDGSVTAPWLAFTPSLAAFLGLSRPFALRAELALEFPLGAARYDVAPLGTLYATSRLVPRGALGIAVEL